ncbi:MAG: rRNA pseudouridine synthase, partial [Rhizobium sp.]|nr:rRNA pseudouridine synthase [Rhizobium sp.]
MEERLQKVMAEYGIASRRKCEEIILDGKVKVNGMTITELGTKIDKQNDRIEVDGIIIKPPANKIYILLNKPVGYITSAKDQFTRPTVLDLVSNIQERVFPVGRLDYDTEGLLLLTNDGDLAYKLTHPKHIVDKTYTALLYGKISDSNIIQFKQGITIDEYKTAPAKLELIRFEKGNSWVNITIHEGKNRQIRRMCSAINHDVIKLKRIQMGDIILDNLEIGSWRFLSEDEIQCLKEMGGDPNDTNQTDII